jgi:stage II sporulation protein D
MNRQSYFYQLLLALLLLLTFTLSAIATEPKPTTLKIGLFNLLKPKTIDIELITDEIVAIKSQQTYKEIPSKILSLNQSLTLVAKANKITCYLKNSQKAVIKKWEVEQLSLSGNNSLSLFVADRLKRQIPAQVSFYAKNGLLYTTLLTNLEDTTKIALASEVSEINNINALQALAIFKAFAIVVRSYIEAEKGRHRQEGYDICDNTHCLLYLGEDSIVNSKQANVVTQAVIETKALVLKFKDKIVPTYFTACCGGLTALPTEVWTGKQHSSYPFSSIKCDYCKNDRFYIWERTIAAKQLWKALQTMLNFRPSAETKLIPIYNDKGVVTALNIKENNYKIKISAAKFRHLVGKTLGWNIVLSNFYQVKFQHQQITFVGKGFGHNLGLCLAGASEQARQDRSFLEILEFYFPNTNLSAN